MDYHQDRFEDASLLVFKDEKLVALLPANKVENTIISHQGLTYGSLIFAETLKLYSVISIFKSVLKYLEKADVSTFYFKQFPRIYNTIPNDEIDYLLFILKAYLYRKDTLSVVNIAEDLKFSKDRILGYKRAVKQGLVVKEENNFELFWNKILITNLENKHKVNPVHTLEEIELLKAKFPKNIRQFNVYKDEEIVAGTTIFETKNVAHSQYISANSDKNILGSLDFLHQYLIKTVFCDKVYFDFGISNENQGLNINQGLQYWKEGFGARTITQDFYKVEVANHKLLDTVLI